ncbi:MAG: hypothetical protein Q8Q01_05245 [archaeon]|nr:hypothetical protein [archaeon]
MNKVAVLALASIIAGCGAYQLRNKTITLKQSILDITEEVNHQDYRLRICERKSEGPLSDEARRYILNNVHYPFGYILRDRYEGLNESREPCIMYHFILQNDKPRLSF